MRCGDFSLFGMTVEEKTYSTNSFSPICESAQIACMNVVGMWTVNINQETIKFKFRIIIDVYPQTSHTHTDTLTQHFEMGNLIIYAKHFDFPFQAQKKHSVCYIRAILLYLLYVSFCLPLLLVSSSISNRQNVIYKCQIKPFIIAAIASGSLFFSPCSRDGCR